MYKFSALDIMTYIPEETLLKLVESSHCLSQISAWIALEDRRRWGGNDEEHPDYCLDFTLFVSKHLDLEAGFFCDYLVDLLVDLGRDDLLEKALPTWYPQNYEGIKEYLEAAIVSLKETKTSPDEYLKDYLDLFKEIKKDKAFVYSQADEVRFFNAKSMSVSELQNGHIFLIEAIEDYFLKKEYELKISGESENDVSPF